MNQQYLNALERSKAVARTEYKFARNNLHTTHKLVSSLRRDIGLLVSESYGLFAASDPSNIQLGKIANSLDHELNTALERYEASLKTKAQQLENFTVMLFGQTMVGKSTIREAITGGNGDTIGKGAQRTTRDVREYQWNNLRMVDTPGFGAWAGEEDTRIAHGVVDESDLILFLLSDDSIQESTIKEMKLLRAKNKPAIFVLNVKFDLTKNFNRKRFLKDPGKYLTGDKVDGHIQRLRDMARTELDMRQSSIKVVPLHALAAFMAKQSENPEEARQLLEASRLPVLFDLLSTEIARNGAVRRIQSIVDGAHNQLAFLDSHLLKNVENLEKYSKTIAEKRNHFDEWFKRYNQNVLPELIDLRVDDIFDKLKQTVSQFVDEHIERDDFNQSWSDHISHFGLQQQLKQLMAELQEDIHKQVEKFNKEVQHDLRFAQTINQGESSSFDTTDYKRITGWGAALAGGLGTLALTMSWNPVGWGLMAAGFIFGLFNFFTDSKEKKLSKQKSKAAADIRKNIDEQKGKAKKEIESWFSKNVENKVVKTIISDTDNLLAGVNGFCAKLSNASSECDTLLNAVNSRLIQQSAIALTKEQAPPIKRIVRLPGEGCFFTVDGYFRNSQLLKTVGLALNEFVTVVYEGSPENMLAHALGINRNPEARIEISGTQAKICVPKKLMGKVIGRNGWRIKLVTALLNLRIQVTESA
ncbi:50S ribosome-binding GTPase [Endozoicomonas gorgoniicola]|uniref:50S ribosome-binding GTPase n=1 Tax=Endozoicomonas gorgoniicola TaxID=1234144 RepID=A0ABT3N0E5_9GAMM|nr:GTPase [Endozoicomonas gorgoniicola]MCW7555096.1 50S ribosome-binding GTPase [Endozoicomonas gorgoniicola]